MDTLFTYTVPIASTVFVLRTITIYILFIFLYDRLSVQFHFYHKMDFCTNK